MKSEGTLLLTRSEVADLLSIEEYIAAVERVFQLYGERKTQPPGMLAVHAHDGGFHIKAGLLELDRSFFAAKINANFPQNAHRFGLPLIQGTIFLVDAQNGYPLAIMDMTASPSVLSYLQLLSLSDSVRPLDQILKELADKLFRGCRWHSVRRGEKVCPDLLAS